MYQNHFFFGYTENKFCVKITKTFVHKIKNWLILHHENVSYILRLSFVTLTIDVMCILHERFLLRYACFVYFMTETWQFIHCYVNPTKSLVILTIDVEVRIYHNTFRRSNELMCSMLGLCTLKIFRKAMLRILQSQYEFVLLHCTNDLYWQVFLFETSLRKICILHKY